MYTCTGCRGISVEFETNMIYVASRINFFLFLQIQQMWAGKGQNFAVVVFYDKRKLTVNKSCTKLNSEARYRERGYREKKKSIVDDDLKRMPVVIVAIACRIKLGKAWTMSIILLHRLVLQFNILFQHNIRLMMLRTGKGVSRESATYISIFNVAACLWSN